MSLSQSLFLAQAISDSTEADANIYIAHTTSKFTSNSAMYNTNPNTKKDSYLIGPSSQGFDLTKPKETAPIVNETEMIQPSPNLLTPTDNKIEPIHPVMDINKTISDAYDILHTIINNKPKQKQPNPNNSVTPKEQEDGSDSYYAPGVPNPVSTYASEPESKGKDSTKEIGNALSQIKDIKG